MAEDPGSPGVAIAGGCAAVGVSGLTGFEILADSVESQSVRRIHDRSPIFAPVIIILLVAGTLEDRNVEAEAGGRPGQRGEINCWMVLGAATGAVLARRRIGETQVAFRVHSRAGHEVERFRRGILQVGRAGAASTVHQDRSGTVRYLQNVVTDAGALIALAFQHYVRRGQVFSIRTVAGSQVVIREAIR